jgi:putative exosortase-associated protein (TIGR04073 family)
MMQEVYMPKLLFAVLFTLATLAPAGATVHSDEEYGPLEKLGRGVADMTTGVLEVPGSMVKETREDGAMGALTGFGIGLARTVARELVGVFEFVTFPIPVPPNYGPVLHPEYAWQYFNDSDLDVASRHRDSDRDTSLGSAD